MTWIMPTTYLGPAVAKETELHPSEAYGKYGDKKEMLNFL